jgi:hypothetical protein
MGDKKQKVNATTEKDLLAFMEERGVEWWRVEGFRTQELQIEELQKVGMHRDQAVLDALSGLRKSGQWKSRQGDASTQEEMCESEKRLKEAIEQVWKRNKGDKKQSNSVSTSISNEPLIPNRVLPLPNVTRNSHSSTNQNINTSSPSSFLNLY